MNFYAYCLNDEVTGEMIEGVAGVAGVPRVVRYGEIAAVVSRFEGESVEVTRENVFAHERVIGHVLTHTTPLPFRFGTVTSAARLESYVESQRESLRAQLASVRGCVEMSVKVIWNAEAVHVEATGGASAGAGRDAPGDDESGALEPGRGTAFLIAKRREILGDERLKARAEEVAAWLSGRLGEAAREMNVNVRPVETPVVAAALLVERARLEEYQERLRAARRERADLHFLTSGPWPPYSFSLKTNS
ncbi:MAG: GvpL/GvpF family gas vesicle protein [Pyrinomonadaceae bacterium]